MSVVPSKVNLAEQVASSAREMAAGLVKIVDGDPGEPIPVGAYEEARQLWVDAEEGMESRTEPSVTVRQRAAYNLVSRAILRTFEVDSERADRILHEYVQMLAGSQGAIKMKIFSGAEVLNLARVFRTIAHRADHVSYERFMGEPDESRNHTVRNYWYPQGA